MKNTRFLLAGLAALFASILFTGCDDKPKIQSILDKALPADWVGDIDTGHKNVWFDFEIRASGLRRTEKGWTWTSLSYRRNGRASTGWITLTPPKSQ
jgi:hypothetical protein